MENAEVKPSEEKTIIGRLGGNPEKTVLKDKHVELAKFSVGVKREGDTETKWYEVSAFSELVPAAEKLKKGDLVSITGKLKVNETEKKTFLNLTAETIVHKVDRLLKGNLASDPIFKSTSKVEVLEFVITESLEGDKKVYHKMAFFKDRAKEANALGMKKGDFVSVVGHESTKLAQWEKDGQKHREAQTHFNGVSVKLLSKKADREAAKDHQVER